MLVVVVSAKVIALVSSRKGGEETTGFNAIYEVNIWYSWQSRDPSPGLTSQPRFLKSSR